MRLSITILGWEVLGITAGKAKKPQAGNIFNNCAFGQPYPLILNNVTPLKQHSAAPDEPKKVVDTDEDFENLVKFVTDKTGLKYEDVRWILKISGEYFG